jgi:hypothetical protein
MQSAKLAELVESLTSGEQEAVRAFIEYLRQQRQRESPSSFLGAVDEFMTEHPELLRRLAE